MPKFLDAPQWYTVLGTSASYLRYGKIDLSYIGHGDDWTISIPVLCYDGSSLSSVTSYVALFNFLSFMLQSGVGGSSSVNLIASGRVVNSSNSAVCGAYFALTQMQILGTDGGSGTTILTRVTSSELSNINVTPYGLSLATVVI